ncbi:MAG: hypothetical protein AAF749_11595, partial [Pseudomonadota bacterium]
PSARVALIDRNECAGGMWNTTYDYVRLHQPYPMFTAGNIRWKLSQPDEYLAKGTEVLTHLKYCLATIESGLSITKFWLSEASMVQEDVSQGERLVTVRVSSLPNGTPTEVISAKKVIYAQGLDVPRLEPLALSSHQVVSCTPQTVSQHFDQTSPVYIVGGGKTGMDSVLALGDRATKRKVSLIVGQGTVFAKRDLLFPTGLRRYFSRHSNLKMLLDASVQFDGSNEEDVFRSFTEKYTTNPGSGGERFLFGQLSEAECARVSELTDDYVYDYLDDVVDTERGPEIVYRSGSRVPIENGALFVNCTGHLFRGAARRTPLLSENNAVLTISSQAAFHFLPAMSSYFLSHLFFAEKLHDSSFYILDNDALVALNPKAAFLTGMTQSLLNTLLALEALPLTAFNEFGLDFDRWHPAYKRLAGLISLQINRQKLIDHCRETLDRIAQTYNVTCHPVKGLDQGH